MSGEFAELVASRREWLEGVLRPWCRVASLASLKLAEQNWLDLAGKVDVDGTLWAWAFSRFPHLVHPELQRIDETHAVTITLADGSRHTGIPDGRLSRGGSLVLLCDDPRGGRRLFEAGPFPLDQIRQVTRDGDPSDATMTAHDSDHAADDAETWTVWRQDDLGNRFVVTTGLTRAAALALNAEYEARGHKQLYWTEPSGSASST